MVQRMVSAQFALIDFPFTRDVLSEYQDLNKYLGGIIEQMPIVLPTPPGVPMPVDFPVVQAINAQKGATINFSSSRIDFIKQVKDSEDFSEYSRIAKAMCQHYQAHSIGRVGIITQYLIDVPNPSEWFLKKVIRDKFGYWQDIMVRFNKPESLYGLSVNNIIQLQEVFIEENREKRRGIHCQVDINTPVTDVRSLRVTDCLKLLTHKAKVLFAENVMEML